jgi:hypothetical protein
MSFSTLERKDNNYLLNTYLYVYNTRPLYSIESEYRNTILRIVKKSILGTNFSFWYSKHSAFISAIVNFIIINTCFVIFPQILFHSHDIEKLLDEMEMESEAPTENKPFSFLSKKKTDFVFRLCISNFIDTIILLVLAVNYKYKERKINKYMQKYTQCAIDEENKIIKDKYNCNISNDGKFSIEIYNNYKYNNNNDFKINNCNKKFFEYVINFPNVKFASSYLYKKAFLSKEQEIITKIVAISEEIDNKYRKKLFSFLLIIISILIIIPICKFFSIEKKLDYINYFGILTLSLFVQRNIFLNNKTEQIKYITSLNYEYINDGYYIYINSDMISLFYLKEEYKSIDCIDKIKELNEQFLKANELI